MHGRNPAHWKLKKANAVARECEQLKTQLALAHTELENKQGAVRRLEILACERSNRVDQLIEIIDRLRQQNKRLDQEADRLAALF